MKRIILGISLVCFFAALDVSGGIKPFPDFKVYIIETRTPSKNYEDAIKIDGKPLLLEYKDGKMTFYKTIEKEINGKKYTFPEFDENGKGIVLNSTDKDFQNHLINIISNNMICMIESKYHTQIAFGLKADFNKDENRYYYLRYFDKDGDIKFQNYIEKASDPLPASSYFIKNSKLLYELNVFDNGFFITRYRCALNPDIQKYPGRDVYNYAISYLGCVWMQLGNKNAVVDGKPSPMPVALELANKNSAVPLQWLVNNYSSSKSYSYDAKKKVAAAKRYINPSEGWRTIEFTIGKDTAKVDGLEKNLPFKVYMKNGTVMVPLKFTNETLNGFSLIWRDYDNTALIYR